MDELQDTRDLVNGLKSGAVQEVAVRIVRSLTSAPYLMVILRNRSGVTVVTRHYATAGLWSASELDDAITSAAKTLVDLLVTTHGVQLTLPALSV